MYRPKATHDTFQPAYVALNASGELARRAAQAWLQLASCDLCARYCRVNRRLTATGAVCRTGERAIVHSFGPHHGEEDPLRGWAGSGTIFFSWCNLRCVFCQNWDISQKGLGREAAPEELAALMLELQRMGCHNINLVSPSHVVAQIIAAVAIAAGRGLRLPLVYNTGGYDSPEALALLDGVIDIYMPDMKYGESAAAHRYSHVRDYWNANRAAVREMHRQVGDLVLDARASRCVACSYATSSCRKALPQANRCFASSPRRSRLRPISTSWINTGPATAPENIRNSTAPRAQGIPTGGRACTLHWTHSPRS